MPSRPLSVLLLIAATAIWAPDPADARQTAQERIVIESSLDIPYLDGAEVPTQTLDVHRPAGGAGRPVVFFIHGGAFYMSDKRDAQYYPQTGERFAEQGWVAVLPNYRLTPSVRYPEHVRDIAAALAWVFEHIDEYGGDPENIFVTGHSAGGFLASAVVLDATWLAEWGAGPSPVRGIIPVCGQFEVVDEGRQGTFGSDRERWAGFSPLNHVSPDAPPFLILEAVRDDWWAPGQAETFHQALIQAKVDVGFEELDHDHFTIITAMGVDGDPVMGLYRRFIERYGALPDER